MLRKLQNVQGAEAVRRGKDKVMLLRKMKPVEHLLTRPLWEKIFMEDSKEFLDYYYKNKTKNNEIYVIETDGEIRSMLQLNPYELVVGTKEVPGRYIVAVATDSFYRGKGYMTELLKKAVRDMYVQKIPFAYLMPANEKIYYPHDFRFVYAEDKWKLAGIEKEIRMKDLLTDCRKGKVTYHLAESEDCKPLAQFVQNHLEMRYNVFTKRDWLYYENILREQRSMNGGILLAKCEEEIKGALLFEEEGKLTVREPIMEEGYETIFEGAGIYLEKEEKKPRIMARLLNVEELFSCMRCKSEMATSFVLVDPVIRENNKLFIIKGNSERIVVRTKPWVKGKYDDVQKISIDALTSIVFGYKSLEKIEEEEQEVFAKEFKESVFRLEPLNKIFLNEIV